MVGLRWNDVHDGALMIDERYCRGDWGAPKSEASCATIAVAQSVTARIHALKHMTVTGKGGGPKNKAVRVYKVVKSDGPNDLVFQSLRTGSPMRDNCEVTLILAGSECDVG